MKRPLVCQMAFCSKDAVQFVLDIQDEHPTLLGFCSECNMIHPQNAADSANDYIRRRYIWL